ncbi:MAG: MauE/DoxX family redox-associated membrane protein [Verrucomicrobiota bacterium]
MARSQQFLRLIAVWVLALVFIYAAIVKIWRPDQFLQDILSYQLLDYQMAWFVAYGLPPLELLAGVSIFFEAWRRVAGGLIFLMMVAFTLALISAWMRGLDISCGCFGKSDAAADYPILLIRDISLACLALYLCLPSSSQR